VPEITEADIKRRIEYSRSARDPNKVVLYDAIREAAKKLMTVIVNVCPDGRECYRATEKVEEAVMWAIAAVAREGE